MSEVQAEPTFGPRLPVVGLILSVVGLCFPPLLVITLGIGLYSVYRARRDERWAPRKQIAQMTLAVSGAGIAIFLGLTLPQLKYAISRVQQAECKAALIRVLGAEENLYQRERRYSERWADLDLTLSPGRGLLRISSSAPLTESGLPIDQKRHPTLSTDAIDNALPQLIRGELGIHGVCPACSFTAACVTNLDADATVDVWTVSTIERTAVGGEKIPGGYPWNERDDVKE